MLPDSVYRQQKGRRGDVVISQGSSLKWLLLWGDHSRHFLFSVFEKVGFDADAIYHILITFTLLQRLQLPGKSFLNLNICLLSPSSGRHRTILFIFTWVNLYHHFLPGMRYRSDSEKGILLHTLHDAGSISRKGLKLSPQSSHSAYTFQSTVTMTLQFTRCY